MWLCATCDVTETLLQVKSNALTRKWTSCFAHCAGRFIWDRESHGSASHDKTLHDVTWHNIKKKRITSVDMTATSLVRDITWHDTSQLTTFNVHHVTSQTTRLLHLTPQPTSWHQNRSNHHHGTSPPWNSRRLVHSKEMVCASRWSVALRAFYRQILSLLYTTFFFWNFRPRLARELLVTLYNKVQSLWG